MPMQKVIYLISQPQGDASLSLCMRILEMHYLNCIAWNSSPFLHQNTNETFHIYIVYLTSTGLSSYPKDSSCDLGLCRLLEPYSLCSRSPITFSHQPEEPCES